MGDPTWSGGSSPSMGFAHPRSSDHTLEVGGLFFLRMETGAEPSMRNSEKGAWKPSWEEAWVVSRGEGRVNRATEPSLEGPGLSCKEEEEKESSQGLGWPLLFLSIAGLLLSARKGHYVQCH